MNDHDHVSMEGTSGPALPSGESSPRRRSKVPLLLTVVLVVAVTVGGSGFAYVNHRAAVAEQHREQVTAARKRAKEAELRREAAARRAALADYKSCRTQVDPFLKALKTVNARLDVGITESTFSNLVGAASVAHDQIDVAAITELVHGQCLTAAASLETALNKYISAAGTWNHCLYEDAYCTTDSIDPQLQRNWSAATRLIDRAQHKLDGADPANGSAGATSNAT